jgi:MFS family permease
MMFRRSLPMSIYSLAAIGGTGLGPVVAGWVELNPRLQWRWIQWIHMMSVRSHRDNIQLTDFLAD